jgi:hypothetical protein
MLKRHEMNQKKEQEGKILPPNLWYTPGALLTYVWEAMENFDKHT